MSDLFGNHIVGFPTRQLISLMYITKFPVMTLKISEKDISKKRICIDKYQLFTILCDIDQDLID